MKRYYFRWADPLSKKEMISRIIAEDFGEAMRLVQQNIDRSPEKGRLHLKLSDFTFLKEENETRPWANKGLDPTAW